ncbi:hypothetical protein [Sagittula sp. P11]|jgi:hypothetical protein|uniref:hypothetical protein n=2 Tax=Sagittula TaxID=58842 RepID=UPI0012FD467C|nr:hypothetical protein [Sagittula sp. P11]
MHKDPFGRRRFQAHVFASNPRFLRDFNVSDGKPTCSVSEANTDANKTGGTDAATSNWRNEMKTLIASTLAATVLLTGVASAAPAPRLSSEAFILLPNADYSNLTDTQVHQINAVVHSGGDSNELRNGIRAVLK